MLRGFEAGNHKSNGYSGKCAHRQVALGGAALQKPLGGGGSLPCGPRKDRWKQREAVARCPRGRGDHRFHRTGSSHSQSVGAAGSTRGRQTRQSVPRRFDPARGVSPGARGSVAGPSPFSGRIRPADQETTAANGKVLLELLLPFQLFSLSRSAGLRLLSLTEQAGSETAASFVGTMRKQQTYETIG